MSGDPLVSVLLPGVPRGKGRHRHRVVKPKSGAMFVHVYSDPETVEYEAALSKAGAVAMGNRPVLEGALTCFVEAFVPIPKSWSKRDHAAALVGDIMPTSKPDGDNYQKICGDGLNRVVWLDDSQIVMWQCLKRYSDFPRMRVSVWAWDDLPAKEPELI